MRHYSQGEIMAIKKEYMSKALSQKDYDCPCVICSFLAAEHFADLFNAHFKTDFIF